MIDIGQQLPYFELTMVKPGFNHPSENDASAFETWTPNSFAGQWKVIYFIQKTLHLYAQQKSLLLQK